VPSRLKRYYNSKQLHFITCSCYHGIPFLARAQRRDLFLKVLEQARRRYRFTVVGYVVMPEHIHLLISEPETGDPSVVMKVVKQRFARMVRKRQLSAAQTLLWSESDPGHVWQKRFYDFNVRSERKRIEKLRYMHRNPVRRGLVTEPDQWRWSSFRSYAYGERSVVRVNFQEWPLEIKKQPRQSFGESAPSLTPLIRKVRE
jgi:putative transposase